MTRLPHINSSLDGGNSIAVNHIEAESLARNRTLRHLRARSQQSNFRLSGLPDGVRYSLVFSKDSNRVWTPRVGLL
jgi:hypothetical protein